MWYGIVLFQGIFFAWISRGRVEYMPPHHPTHIDWDNSTWVFADIIKWSISCYFWQNMRSISFFSLVNYVLFADSWELCNHFWNFSSSLLYFNKLHILLYYSVQYPYIHYLICFFRLRFITHISFFLRRLKLDLLCIFMQAQQKYGLHWYHRFKHAQKGSTAHIDYKYTLPSHNIISLFSNLSARQIKFKSTCHITNVLWVDW